MHFQRRTFLRGTATAIVVAAAGCSSRAPGDDGPTTTDTGDDRDSVPALTGHTVSEHVVTPSTDRSDNTDAWGLFLATRAAADASFGDVSESSATEVRTFIDETAFDAGDRLLYLHAFAPQTCYELRLAGPPRVAENGLPHVDAEVARTAPEGEPCAEAITPVRLLCRLSFDLDAGSTDVVEARISGPRETTDLRLEAER